MEKPVKLYNLKVIVSGNRVEIYKFNNMQREGYKRSEDEEHWTPGNKIKSDKSENRLKTLNKSQNSIIRLIQSNLDMTTFITLTFKDEMDFKTSKKELNNLFNKLRKVKKDLKYIWVLEYGEKNDRLHYHLLTDFYSGLDLKIKNRKTKNHKEIENDFMKKYWNNLGFVDIRDFKAEENINVALYVSAYIVKSIKDYSFDGFRVYGYSHKTLNKPIEAKVQTKQSIEELLMMYPDYKLKYTSDYEVGYKHWDKEYKGICTYLDLIKK